MINRRLFLYYSQVMSPSVKLAFSNVRLQHTVIGSFLLLVLFYNIARYGIEILGGGNRYLTGDWLINYAGGFTPRGLNGEVIYLISKITHVSPLYVVFIEQASLYAIFYIFFIYLLKKDYFKNHITLLMSPALLMFGFLDSGGIFRKELIGFIAITFLVLGLINRAQSISCLTIALGFFVLLSFSWELSIIFFPCIYLLLKEYVAVDLISNTANRRLSLLFFLPSTLSLLGAAYFARYRTNAVSVSICNSLINSGLDSKICDGTISSITEVNLNFMSSMRILWADYGYGYYLFALILLLLPFANIAWLRVNKAQVVQLLLPLLPLFMIEADYGRNLQILIVTITYYWVAKKATTKEIVSESSNTKYRIANMRLLVGITLMCAFRVPAAGKLPEDFFPGLAVRVMLLVVKLCSSCSAFFTNIWQSIDI